ncbi:MAG TPA: hypothetical protein VFC23_13590 [Thermoanaerobaculia bacterium]|nr:hypothetical protein [Thermoanaerobaculia bacterium]
MPHKDPITEDIHPVRDATVRVADHEPETMPKHSEPRSTAAAFTRTERLLTITERLIIMTTCALLLVVTVFGVTLLSSDRFMVSWACFGCGLLGGFVSIQQRLKKFGNEELELLSTSWFQILLIPIYGGIFALVLYITFLSNIVQGPLFPVFASPTFSKPSPSTEDLRRFFLQTYPATGADLAKLLFWTFVAGFSERFVPQLIDKTQTRDA